MVRPLFIAGVPFVVEEREGGRGRERERERERERG